MRYNIVKTIRVEKNPKIPEILFQLATTEIFKIQQLNSLTEHSNTMSDFFFMLTVPLNFKLLLLRVFSLGLLS